MYVVRESEIKELVSFMDLYFADSVVWVTPSFPSSVFVDGIEFRKVVGVQGVVVFGDKYPLSGKDVSLHDHLIVFRAIQAVEANGVIVSEIGSGVRWYVGNDGTKFTVS